MAQALGRRGAAMPGPRRAHRAGDGTSATTLVVDGMVCGGCMRKVEAALTALPAVVSARANLSARRVTAVHAASAIAAEDLVTALAKAGFAAAELGAAVPAVEGDAEVLKRLAVAGFAAANIMLLSISVWSGAMGDMSPSLPALFHWLSALLALPTVAYAGRPFFASAAGALATRRLNMDVPISLGIMLATGMSMLQTLHGGDQVYFDAAVALLFFLLVGRYLDLRMRARAVGAAANLLNLRASAASVLAHDGTASSLPARLLVPGMLVLTRPGERFAVDGRIRDGRGEVDESLITGETLPRAVAPDDRIYAGTMNLSSSLVTEVTAADDNTLLAEIARLMTMAEQARGRYVRLADRAARFYAPAVHVLGLATCIGWSLAGQGWEAALTAAIAVLIITCPCALALAVPAVQVAASSRLFDKGILVKSPDALERLAEVDAVVFDKTGTLTLGEPTLSAGQRIAAQVLARAAALAAASRHPYARAVVRAAEAHGQVVVPAAGVREEPGCGLQRLDAAGCERLGSGAWCGAPTSEGDLPTLWYRDTDGSLTALRLEDPLRADAADVVRRLRRAGLYTELLSGDRSGAVASAAVGAGLDTWRGGVPPTEKMARLVALKAEGRKVLMVGDGLNDAPALAAAHASLSPASAADISQTAADGVFKGARLAPILEVIAVARAAHRLALQNFAIAVGYNCLFVPLAMTGRVTPLLAAVAMSASSIVVTANAVRLRTRPLELGT